MFDNIGGKIKTLAMVICVIGIIASIICAIALWAQNSRYSLTIALGFGVLVGGCVGSWVGSFFMYGFGELIEETTRNREINDQILRLLSVQNAPTDSKPFVRDVPVAFSQSSARNNTKPLRDTQGGWVCKACGSRNSSGDVMCKDCGLSVPEDVSIISFNDSLFARLTLPQLTSIDVNSFQLGIEAASQLINHIENPNLLATKIIVPHKLIERHSCIAVR